MERVASYQEADRIKNLITLFSSYSLKEIEKTIEARGIFSRHVFPI